MYQEQKIKGVNEHLSFRSLLKLSYWPAWFLVGFLRLCAFLPYAWLIEFGKIIGLFLWLLPLKIKRTTQINLARCFPELSPAEQEKLLKKNFISVGIGLMETALAWFGDIKKIVPLTYVRGLDKIDTMLAAGKRIIFISPHFTTLQIVGRVLSLSVPFAVVYRPQKNPVFNYITQRSLNKYYHQTIAKGDVRTMMRCLEKNIPIWFTPDIDAGLKNSIFVPFFSVPAATITLTARLAEKNGACVMPVFFYRRDDGLGYEVTIALAEDFPSGDVIEDTARINAILEKGIRDKPEQYIWQYKRFKTRPQGEKRWY